jgi:hypothetical protein
MRIFKIAVTLAALVSPIWTKNIAGDEASDEEPTKFNGIQVPPMTLLTGTSMKETIAKGYW